MRARTALRVLASRRVLDEPIEADQPRGAAGQQHLGDPSLLRARPAARIQQRHRVVAIAVAIAARAQRPELLRVNRLRPSGSGTGARKCAARETA